MSNRPHHALLAPFGWDQRFEVLEKIGAGAMGQIWRAREIATDRIVALKMIDPARCGDEQILARLEIEGETLTKLRSAGQHEHVVPILDFKITDSHACLVMEFIPGLNLKKWCSTHQLSLQDRVRLIAQVARASGWFHALGIVHRDLKPANILVHTVTRQPVIVDFSIAKVEDTLTLTLTNEALGTAPYMAPEQFDKKRGPISPASDVFALGATLYELLTQVHPHPGDFPQILQRLVDEVRPAPPSALNPAIPRDLESIILKALSHRPTDRYTDGTALADDLDRFLVGEPVKARPLPLATRLLRRARRKPALTTALVACFVLGSLAVWNVQRRASERERHELVARLNTEMQHRKWDATHLNQAEDILVSLDHHDADLAGELRQQLHEDVARDIETLLMQSHLKDEDFIWLRTHAAWLASRSSPQAKRLQVLINERVGRWETLAELRAPFADMQGLFAGSKMRVAGDLIYPAHDLPASKVPDVEVAKSLSAPLEMACTFVADKATFTHVSMDFAHENARVLVALYRASHAPANVLKRFGDEQPDPQQYILFIAPGRVFQRAILVPDPHLLDKPFQLTLRMERDRADAFLNGRWKLQINTGFALGNVMSVNFCRISWCRDIGLQKLILRTRRSDAASPLDHADFLAGQAHWTEARRFYENLRGDPLFGNEAEYKIAECLLRGEGNRVAATSIWKRLLQSPPSSWRDRSLLQLWVHSILNREADSARYTALLPDPLPPEMLQQIDRWMVTDLERACALAGMGIALPRMDAASVTESAKVHRLLQIHPVQTASRFGMALNSVRLDQEAEYLYRHGLAEPESTANGTSNLRAAANCLDQWCRIVPSEMSSPLNERLDRWQRALKGDGTIQAITNMEKARRAARGGDLRSAIAHMHETHEKTPEKLDGRVHCSLWLLEGMLYRTQGDERKAQHAWQKAQEIADTVTMRHPLHLCDCVLLHSLTQTWDLRVAGDVLTILVGKHLKGSARTAAQAAFNQTFLTDPAWLHAFNTVLQDERGRKLAEDYTLCLDPPRELVQRFYRLLFEHYFLSTAFPQATTEQTTRVRQIVDTLVTEMSMNPRGEIAHLHAYLRAWNDPAAAKTLFESSYPYSPTLIESLKWLLQQRHPS